MALRWFGLLSLVALGPGSLFAQTAVTSKTFETVVAPLLAQHCLECHGPSSKKGKLDLSTRAAAFAGGKSGKALVPGKLADSLIWEHVEGGRMPPRSRPALSEDEKKRLRGWIETGAAWPEALADITRFRKSRETGSPWVRRLTVPEYIETVRSLLGVDIAAEAQRMLPRDQRADGFRNTAYNLTIDLAHVEAYAKLAEHIAEQTDRAAFRKRLGKPGETGEPALRHVVAALGERLFRGPLSQREVESFFGIVQAVKKEGGDDDEAVRYVLEGMLQSPRFLFRMEESNDARSLASRLSYIVWGAPPDDELLRLAAAGKLDDEVTFRAQVDRLVKDPRAVAQSRRFLSEWLDLDRLNTLRPDGKRFPNWTPQLAADMRDETLQFFEEVVWKQGRPLGDLLNAPVTFLTPRLAAHYGIARGASPDKTANRPGDLAGRTTAGLEVLYTFTEGRGDVVRDVAQRGEALNLKISKPAATRWTSDGLALTEATLLSTVAPPKRLLDVIKKTNAFTVEAWITPAATSQRGPARIVSLSSGISARNFTLGQEHTAFDFRLRQRGTDGNGMPGLSTPTGMVHKHPMHVVFTRDAAGKALFYLDGEVVAKRDRAGDLASWDSGFSLLLGNESSNDRPWKGTFHMVALYSRALSAGEVASNHQGLARYDLSKVPSRGGLLTQGSVLTIGGDEGSTVTRGLFVLRELLYSGVDDPPPCVDTTPTPAKPGLSQRALVLQRINNKACADCHSRFETIALGLEKFDGIGRHRDKDEHGNTLRDDGSILFPDADQPTAFRNSAELMDLLAKSPRVHKALTRKVLQFSLGRPLRVTDEPYVESIHAATQKAGGTYASLLKSIVSSDLVRRPRPQSAP
jgi:hypothetical protein